MTDQLPRTPIEPRPATATFFVTCLVDQFRPAVGEAVVDVLESHGLEVDVPVDQTCCGQPAFNSGFREEAREVAARFLDVFDSSQSETPIVCPSGSCSAMVRNYYPVLFRNEPEQLERVKRVADRLWEFSEFLVDGIGAEQPGQYEPGQVEGSPPGNHPSEAETKLAYHRCCHALRELGIDRQPEQLLSEARDAERVELGRSEVCCGFGGSFSVKMADISTAMLDEKLDNVEASGADLLVAGDTGCIMHMEGGLRRRGADVRVLHIAELLAEAARQKAVPGNPVAASPGETE